MRAMFLVLFAALLWSVPASSAQFVAGYAYPSYAAPVTDSGSTSASLSLSTSTRGIGITSENNSELAADGSVDFHTQTDLIGTLESYQLQNISITAFATFHDTLAITGGTGGGTAMFSLQLSGSVDAHSTPLYSWAEFESFVCVDSPSQCYGGVGAGTNGGSPSKTLSGTGVIGTIPFTYGVPFTFSVMVESNGIAPYDMSVVGQDIDLESNLDAMLGPIKIDDINGGNSGAQITSLTDSRISYQTALPEPATWTFLLVGFSAAGPALRRHRQLSPLPLGAFDGF